MNKTDDTKGEYGVEDSVENAMAMLGTGYDNAAEIHPPKTIRALQDKGLTEYKVWGWVKISANFINHIKKLKGAKLAIWQVVALSIDENGKCNLSLNEIAYLSGYSRSEVIESLKELDEMGYLSADKQAGKKSIYEPDFAARSVNTPTSDPSRKTTRPVSSLDYPSSPSIQNAHSSIKELKELIPLTIENAIATGQPITEEVVFNTQIRDLAPKMFEKALGFSKPLPWWNGKEWTAFAEWVCDRYAESKTSFGEYNIWRNTPFTKGGMANTRIRGFITEFYDSWDMFVMSKPQKQTDETRPEYQAFPFEGI